MSESLVTSTRLEDGRVLRLHIDNPKGNILSMAVLSDLERKLADHQEDAKLKLVVLDAAGRNFSFGASVEEHERDKAPQMLDTFHRVLRHVAGYHVPVAAVVQGRCLGGAFELALCCHFVFATKDAVFACPEIKLGVFPPVLAAVGAHRLGGALAERMLLTGATLGLDAFEASGFISHVVGEAPFEDVMAWYRDTLAPLSACGLGHATRVVRQASGLLDCLGAPLAWAERHYVDELLETHDANEGIAAFIERRPPVWEDA